MQRYAKKLVHDMNIIATKDYEINGFNVKFSFELLPSDMKWLAFMGGELSNAAYYFSYLVMCVRRLRLLSIVL